MQFVRKHSMHRPRLARSVATLAVTTGLLVSPLVFAGAANAVTRGATCTKMVVSLTGTGTLSGCSNLKATAGSGKLVGNLKSKTATITWHHTGTTTATFTYATVKTDERETETHSCAKGTTEILISGVVTGGTGAAGKAIAKGSKVSAELCITAKGGTLEPGSLFSI